MAATQQLMQLLPEDVIRVILEFLVESKWQVLADGVALGCVRGYVDGTCRLFRKISWELRWKLEYPDGKVLLNARSSKLRLLKGWFGSSLRSLVISVASLGADSVQDDIDSMQHNLLGGFNLDEAFPGLKSLTLSACAREPVVDVGVEEAFVLGQPDGEGLDEDLDEVQPGDSPAFIGQCRYDLDHLGDVPRGAVFAVDRFPLPNRTSSGFESVEMHNINDPAEFNLESLTQSGIKSFSISGHNGMSVDHLAMLPDCLERLAITQSDRFDCWLHPSTVQWPQCLTVLELCNLHWKPAAPSLPLSLKSLVVRGSSGLKSFDLSWLPHTLESLEVDKPLREMGPFPPQLKFISMFAGADAVLAPVVAPVVAPAQPLTDAQIQALANEYLQQLTPALRELIQFAPPHLLAQSAMQAEAIENFIYSAFVLDLDKLPSTLEVLELTGIRKKDISDLLHVSGQFERLMYLREVRSVHQGVLDYLKEQGKPCTTHLKFVRKNKQCTERRL